jgi:sigma-B regulation protein RsbU (phosphoserine phosphatase)
LTSVNDTLIRDSDGSMFVTVCYGILDLETGEVTYAKGGHPPPFVIGASSASGVRHFDLAANLVLGMVEKQEYVTHRDRLQPGDVLLVYSDGINEAANARGELLSLDGVKAALEQLTGPAASAVTEHIVAAVKAFEGDAPQADDITVLAVQWRGATV